MRIWWTLIFRNKSCIILISSENQSLIILFNAACLGKKQQILILLSFVWPGHGSSSRFSAVDASTLTITPLCPWVQLALLDLFFLCVIFNRYLFVLLFFFFWPLCCLSCDYGFWLPIWYLQSLFAKMIWICLDKYDRELLTLLNF